MSAREVELTGGAPWGFRMHGGADQNQPLRISRRFSDTLERTLDVNPGRKASLSGIREGDVISSINGRPTKGMSNADAHAMLRSAGPVLRLGLNEDREMSPRRRSIGKGSELKRPSQMIAEVQKATPQAPVYATIRPSQSPQHRPSSSPMRSSLNSLPSALNSTPLVKSAASNEEPLRFHPTNPFYTTLPSNYSSASKLPVPNGRASFSGLDRNKSKDDYGSDLKSPSFFTKNYDSGPTSLPYVHRDNINGYEATSKSASNERTDNFSYDKFKQYHCQGLPNETNVNNRNPFETKRNSDPFEKYLRPECQVNGKCDESKPIPSSISDNNFHRKEEITKCSTVTEHKISEIEEVKTIKKMILNGSGDSSDYQDCLSMSAPPKKGGINEFEFNAHPKEHFKAAKNEHIHEPTQQRNDYASSSFDHTNERSYTANTYQAAADYCNKSPAAEAPSVEVVASKPPVKSPSGAHTPLSSHTSKREYTTILTTYPNCSPNQPK